MITAGSVRLSPASRPIHGAYGGSLTGMGTDSGGRLRRALSRFASTTEDIEAEELQQEAASRGATSVCDIADRQRAAVCGTLRAVTLRPRGRVPALEAEVYDGSGALTLIWMGRRRIPGIDCGRGIVVEGRVMMSEGRKVMFNPRYRLRPVAGE
jgi:hypothetical protein